MCMRGVCEVSANVAVRNIRVVQLTTKSLCTVYSTCNEHACVCVCVCVNVCVVCLLLSSELPLYFYADISCAVTTHIFSMSLLE